MGCSSSSLLFTMAIDDKEYRLAKSKINLSILALIGGQMNKIVKNSMGRFIALEYNMTSLRILNYLLVRDHPLSTYAPRGRGGGYPKAYVVREVA